MLNRLKVARSAEETQVSDKVSSFLAGRGGLYLSARYAVGVLISVANMFVLTWLIGPHHYGLFVTAISITSVLASLVRSGLDTYLVRCEHDPSREDFDTAWSAIAAFSACAMLIGAAVLPLLTWWLHSGEFVGAYLATLLTVPLAGLAGPATAKLERALEFRAVATIELVGQSLALFSGLYLALQGFGLWAPVAGQLIWQLFVLIAGLRIGHFRPRFRMDRVRLRQMLAFGVGYTASQRTWQLRALVNPLIVGRFIGAEGVAFVGLAIRIAEGLGFVRTAGARLAIASLARVQHDAVLMSSALRKAIRGQVIVLGTLLGGFAVLAPFLFGHVIGFRWVPVLRVYPLLALAVLVNSIYNLQAAALFVIGRQWIVLGAYLVHVLLLAVAALVFIPRFGLMGYGIADLFACCAYPVLHIGAHRSLGNLSRVLWLWVFSFGLLLATPFTNGMWFLLTGGASLAMVAVVYLVERRGSGSQLKVLCEVVLRG